MDSQVRAAATLCVLFTWIRARYPVPRSSSSMSPRARADIIVRFYMTGSPSSPATGLVETSPARRDALSICRNPSPTAIPDDTPGLPSPRAYIFKNCRSIR